jgi:hypothetical protein
MGTITPSNSGIALTPLPSERLPHWRRRLPERQNIVDYTQARIY